VAIVLAAVAVWWRSRRWLGAVFGCMVTPGPIGGCGMSMLPLAVPGQCPRSADSRAHTWQSGDSADLISFGEPDHGVSVYLGRCSCVVPLLAVVRVSEALRGDGPFLDVRRTDL
jgi:hypothetical protein